MPPALKSFELEVVGNLEEEDQSILSPHVATLMSSRQKKVFFVSQNLSRATKIKAGIKFDKIHGRGRKMLLNLLVEGLANIKTSFFMF